MDSLQRWRLVLASGAVADVEVWRINRDTQDEWWRARLLSHTTSTHPHHGSGIDASEAVNEVLSYTDDFVREVLPPGSLSRGEFETAIRTHRDARGHARCYLDDRALYAVLGDGVEADLALPPHDEMMAQCARYSTARRDPSATYVEPDDVAGLRAEIVRLQQAIDTSVATGPV